MAWPWTALVSYIANWRIKPAPRPLKQDVIGNIGRRAVGSDGHHRTVLLIACANVANLLLVRAKDGSRNWPFARRSGAGWSRIAAELLLESLLLGLIGGAVGVVPCLWRPAVPDRASVPRTCRV